MKHTPLGLINPLFALLNPTWPKAYGTQFAEAFAIFAASPAHIKWRRPSAASTRGAGSLRPPAPFVDSIIWAGEAANIAKASANYVP